MINRTETGHIVKEWIMLWRYYRLTRYVPASGVVARIDGRCHDGGLMDKICGAISVYAFAKGAGLKYMCVFNYPLSIDDYLMPAGFDWRGDENSISDSMRNVRIRILWGEENPDRLYRPDLWNNYQLHIYANRNYVDKINTHFGTDFTWSGLFKELFRPGDELQALIDYHRAVIGNSYVCCTFRFQSLLGDFKEYDFPTLPAAERESLVKKNIKALEEICERFKKPVLVTSDSSTFLEAVHDLKWVYVLPGKVVHIDCSPFEEKRVYMKSFLDFYMISYAERVFCVGTKEMYTSSSFPMYAAKVNDVPFEKVII